MTSKIAPVSNAFWIPFESTDMMDLQKIITSYLDRRDIIYLLGTSYASHGAVIAASKQFSREDEACKAEGYPKKLIKLFEINCLSLWRIPLLTPLPSDTFVKPKDMGDLSIVRYKRPDGCAAVTFQWKCISAIGTNTFFKLNLKPREDTPDGGLSRWCMVDYMDSITKEGIVEKGMVERETCVRKDQFEEAVEHMSELLSPDPDLLTDDLPALSNEIPPQDEQPIPKKMS